MSKVYDVITDRIVAMLESGTVPWHKPWKGASGFPRNLVSKKPYRGINVFMLLSLGYESPYFLTFNQAKKLGGCVRKGEKGTPVIFWKRLSFTDEDDDGQEISKAVPMLRYYTVFNVAQVDGIDEKLPEGAKVEEREHDPIAAAETIVKNMPNAPAIQSGTRACYMPTSDIVEMPRPEVFESGEAYYSAMFHELTHSTGHTKRLDRKLDEKLAAFGSPDYSREELVAEMGAAFLCGEAGVVEATIEQSAAYVQGWLKALKDDRKLVVVAAAQAQKAADFILNRKFDN